MKTHVGPGDVMSWMNQSGSTVASGAVVEFGTDAEGFIGIAGADIADDAIGPVAIEGVFELPAVTADAWVEGTPLYWDGTKLTDTATSNHFAGIAMDVKVATTQTKAKVKLCPGARTIDTDT